MKKVFWRIIQKVDPRNLLAPKKFYLVAVHLGKVDETAVAEEMAKRSGLSVGDAKSNLYTACQVIFDFVMSSNIVELSDFFTVAVNLESEGSDTMELADASKIRNAKMVFRLTERGKDLLKQVKFEKFNPPV